MQKTLSHFIGLIVQRKAALNKIRTAETYASALRSFMRFREGADLSLSDLTPFLIQRYEAWLLASGVSPNTSSFYLRKLRSAYNLAVDEGLVTQQFPFRQVYTGKSKTIKRAVSAKVLRKIQTLSLSDKPYQAFARDLFLFSLYTRGMSFIDMAYLRKSDLHDGILTYRRHKTGQQLSIRWEPCMQSLLEKFQVQSSKLLPIIMDTKNERKQYLRSQQRTNYALKRMCEDAGITPAITMYVARHSWATLAQSNHVPISIISSGMGHDSERTTRIYLASIDTNSIDNANRKILKGLGV